MHDISILLALVVVFALVFDFLNGFHDAANAIATIVVTRLLSPLQAVLLAGFANFVGYFTFGVAIAKMIGQGVINIESITLPLLLSAVFGAIVWNILTWLLGLPTSSSHALIGGLIGAGIASSGFHVIILNGVLKIFLFIFVAPMIGMGSAILFTSIIITLFKNVHPKKAQTIFRPLRIISVSFYCIGHGTNDAQKTMGIIAMALFSAGYIQSFEIPQWVVFSCYCAISLGTMLGGWRIVKTMGTKITKIRTMEGFSAECAASLVLIGTAQAGIPVSTTHVIASSIMGVGTVEHAAKVRWLTARNIVWAWLLTIPATAACGGLCYVLLSLVE